MGEIKRDANYIYYLGKDGHIWASPRKGHHGAKKRVGTKMHERKSGYLYYVDGQGNVGMAKMKHR